MTETTASTKPEIARRDFLKGGTAVAAMVVSGGAVIHTTEAWGMQPKALSADTARSLVRIARDIFPHDRIADRFYAVAVKTTTTRPRPMQSSSRSSKAAWPNSIALRRRSTRSPTRPSAGSGTA